MTLHTVGMLYLASAVLLLLTACAFWALLRWKAVHPSAWKTPFLVLVFASLALPCAAWLLPTSSLPRPAAQVWSGGGRQGETYKILVPSMAAQTAPVALSGITLPSSWGAIAGILLMLGIAWKLGQRLRQRSALRRFLRAQWPVHSLGRVRVLAGDAAVAFSARIDGLSYIVLPTSVYSTAHRRIVLAHEAQHHRARDPQIANAVGCLQALFFWNPAGQWLARTLEEIQEFACDAFLLDRRKVASQDYSRCLFEAAQSALNSRAVFAGTTGMATSASGHFLKRRIQMMLNNPTSHRTGAVKAITVAVLVLLSGLAVGARSAVQTRTLSMADAQAAAEKANANSGIPLDVNEIVLKHLQYFTGTVEGRKWMKESLGRMAKYKSLIDSKTQEYGLPSELIGVPLFESGFRTDAISPEPYRGAGMWQFIPQTAKRFGMKVADTREGIVPGKDDRLNPEKETEAAMKYFTELHKQFGDWRLAIKAYNEGEVRVKNLVKKHGNDPWNLERTATRESYLGGAIAAMIIYKNPTLLD